VDGAADFLHGKLGPPARLSLGPNQAKLKFACSSWCSLATSCRRVAVGGAGGGAKGTTRGAQRTAVRSLPLPTSCHITQGTSDGVPVPTSVLWKQAKPGGRKRSAQAVNDGPDGRSERQASGHGHPRAAAAATVRKEPTSCRPFLGGPPPAGADWRLPAAGWQLVAGAADFTERADILSPSGSTIGSATKMKTSRRT
jgi:hypothetical protein